MRSKFVIFFLIFSNIVECHSQVVGPQTNGIFDTIENYIDFYREDINACSAYLGLRPIERLDYFTNSYNKISAAMIMTYELDILTLGNLDSLSNFREEITDQPFIFVLGNDSGVFRNAIKVLRDSLLTKHYISICKVEPLLSFPEMPRDVLDLFTLYFENTPKNRIVFLETYYRKLPYQLVDLLKI